MREMEILKTREDLIAAVAKAADVTASDVGNVFAALAKQIETGQVDPDVIRDMGIGPVAGNNACGGGSNACEKAMVTPSVA